MDESSSQHLAAADAATAAVVDESRPRLRSRRDGRMSAAGRLAEQAAEAAAAAGLAADGASLVVSACRSGSLMLCRSSWVLGFSGGVLVTKTCVLGSLACSRCIRGQQCCSCRRQADGRGAAVSWPQQRPDADTNSVSQAAPGNAVAAELVSNLVAAATSGDSSAAHGRPETDAHSTIDTQTAGGQTAVHPGAASAAVQQVSQRAGGMSTARGQSPSGADGGAGAAWQAELAGALRTAHVKAVAKVAEDERRLAQTALTLLPVAVDNAAEEES